MGMACSTRSTGCVLDPLALERRRSLASRSGLDVGPRCYLRRATGRMPLGLATLLSLPSGSSTGAPRRAAGARSKGGRSLRKPMGTPLRRPWAGPWAGPWAALFRSLFFQFAHRVKVCSCISCEGRGQRATVHRGIVAVARWGRSGRGASRGYPPWSPWALCRKCLFQSVLCEPMGSAQGPGKVLLD